MPDDEGVPKHYLAPWCEESDIPRTRLEGVTDVDLAFMIAAATDLLYTLSGRQFRIGRSIVRPASISASYGTQSYLYPYASMSGYGSAWGFAAGWSWSAVGMGWWQNGQDLSEVKLQGPVRKINNVLVDGVNLGAWPPTNPNYTLYDRRRLIRNVNTGSPQASAWPWNQQLQLGLDQPGTWMIDYEWGKSPGPMGKLACIELALELALTLTGTNKARLPARVVSIATEGLNVAVGDALSYIRESLVGIPACDLFLQAKNPGRLRRGAIFVGPNSVQQHGMAGYPNS